MPQKASGAYRQDGQTLTTGAFSNAERVTPLGKYFSAKGFELIEQVMAERTKFIDKTTRQRLMLNINAPTTAAAQTFLSAGFIFLPAS